MKTQYYTASSLDGFIATEDHSLEWFIQLGDIADTGYADFIKEVGALAMGSVFCRWMLRHVVKPDSGAAWPYSQPTWVFSSRSLPNAAEAISLSCVATSVRCTPTCARPQQARTSGSSVAGGLRQPHFTMRSCWTGHCQVVGAETLIRRTGASTPVLLPLKAARFVPVISAQLANRFLISWR